MNSDECKLIRCFAKGECSKEKALEVFRVEMVRVANTFSNDAREKIMNTPEMRFMREIDSVCPDLGLRAEYRLKLVEIDKKQ